MIPPAKEGCINMFNRPGLCRCKTTETGNKIELTCKWVRPPCREKTCKWISSSKFFR